MRCEAVNGICSCRLVASGGRSPGFGAIWRGPWESTGRCSEWRSDLAHCSPDARARVVWPLLELLSHQALAAEMLFQVWRIKQEERGRVSEEAGKGAGLHLEQPWAQGKAVISADRGGIQEREEGPRL